jgi:hypothetical protein
MLKRITQAQRDALPIIDQTPAAPGIAPVTLDALVSKGLVERFEHDGHRSNYRLTGDGRLMCGEITEAADGPAMPADPFTAFDQFDTEGL